MADQGHDRELKNALAQIEKQFGKGAIMQLGERSAADVQGIPSGALSLDIALGGRGLPRGRIVEIFGPEASGKTTVALHAVANAQKQGGVAAYINQIRQKIGLMFGNPETTSGGMALKFYSSVRLDIRKVTSIKDGEETVGARVKVRVVKNKVAPPFRQAEFDLMHDRGISREGDLLDLAIEDKLVDKSGSWINYGDVRLGQGRENAKQYLRENPALVEELTR